MSWASPVFVVVALKAYAALVVTAARNRLLARVAAREAIRRPLQSALVIAGLTVGTGAVLGPVVWGESISDSLAAAAERQWAKVDVTVSAGGTPFSSAVADRLAAGLGPSTSVTGVQAGLDLVGTVLNPAKGVDHPAVRLVGFDPAAQAPFGAWVLADGTRTYGDALGPGQIIMSRSLAEAIKADSGDRIIALVDGRAIDLTVAGVARPEGPGLYGLRPTVFAPLATASAFAGSEQINVVRITAAGDGQAEAAAAHQAALLARATLGDLTSIPALDVREVKAEEVAAFRGYEEASGLFFLGPTFVALILGSALVVNLMLSIADERRPRLAVLRALGLSRRGLVTLSLLEGGIYSLAAALFSLVTGAVIAWVMFAYSGTADLSDVNGREVAFEPSFRPATIASVVALGALVTLLTVAVTAVRTSRMTIASAIRDLPDRDPLPRRSWFRLAWLTLVASAGVLGVVAGDPRLRLLSGLALVFAAAGLTRGRLPDRTRVTLSGLLVLAWSLVTLSTYGADAGSIVAVELFLLAAATSVLGLALVVAANLRVLERLVGLLGSGASGLRATLRPPLAYLTRRPMRAGLTIGVLGLTIAGITIWTLVEATGLDYDRDAGGFDVELTSVGSTPIALPPAIDAQVERSVALPTHRYLGKVRLSFGPTAVAKDWREQVMPLYELPGEISSESMPRLGDRNPKFATDADAFRAVASDPTWVFAEWLNGPDSTVSLYGQGGPTEFKVAGSFGLGLLAGIVGSPEALAPFAAGSATSSTVLLDARDGVDADALARDIRSSLFSQGVTAIPTRTLLDQGQVQGHTWSSIFRTFSILSLVSGIFSLGVLALRNVLERRRAIGVLRALGWQRRQVLGGVLLEATLTTGLAIALGLAAGLESSWFIHQAVTTAGPDRGVDTALAVTSLVVAFGILLAVTVVVTIGPAVSASRLAPVDALRSID